MENTERILNQIKDLFSANLTALGVCLKKSDNVLIACRDNDNIGAAPANYDENPIVLLPYDNTLMAESPVCSRLTKLVTREEVMAIPNVGKYVKGTELLQDSQFVILCPEMKEFFMSGYIESIEDFYEYMKFADKYMLNIPYICSRGDRIMWLLSVKERQKDIWRENRVLLSNIEQKIFDKPKFTVNALPAGPAPYPVGSAVTPAKYVTMNEIPRADFLPKKDFADLVSILIRNGANDFVAKILAVYGSSIEYYDVIYGNADIIKMTRTLPPFAASTFYAFRVMYLEELSMYHRKRAAGRFILDISAAEALPATSEKSFTNSPYFSCLANRAMPRTGLTIPALLEGARGLYTLGDFRARLDIFTNDTLKYIEYNDEFSKTAVTGSAITACCMRNPLEKYFGSPEEYFAEYYPSRRNQQMETPRYKAPSMSLFSYLGDTSDDSSDSLSERSSNSEELNNNTDNNDDSADNDGDSAPIDDDKISHKIEYSDVDLMVACEWGKFDDVARKHYQAVRRAVEELNLPYEITMELVKTENKHKYIIRGLPREIDIFHVDDIPSTIVKYHLGCVRAWYDGETIWCFPSFITAAEIGVNLDIRWTSNRKDVRDIVLKYFQRGFGTAINMRDRRSLIDYVDSSQMWCRASPRATLSRWRVSRYWSEPLFHSSVGAMFNPSRSRVGIHKYLDTAFIGIATPRTYKLPSRARRLGSSKNSSQLVDYKSRAETILPSACRSLSVYL